MIVVIDYSVGNVKSVCNALKFIGCENELSNDFDKIRTADGIILPGVAAFGFAAAALGETAEVIKEVAKAGKPLLGICVGFQLLFDSSCELGYHSGLSLVEGKVVPLPSNVTVPHMGWNRVEIPEDMTLLKGLRTSEHFYFAHSFHAQLTDKDAKVAYTEYDKPLVASVQKDNIFGVQFHPEKSGDVGMAVLRNFESICKGELK